jgi:hypothetical protein
MHDFRTCLRHDNGRLALFDETRIRLTEPRTLLSGTAFHDCPNASAPSERSRSPIAAGLYGLAILCDAASLCCVRAPRRVLAPYLVQVGARTPE